VGVVRISLATSAWLEALAAVGLTVHTHSRSISNAAWTARSSAIQPPAKKSAQSRYRATVMAGLVPAIHVFISMHAAKTWMPATSAGMTSEK
jgi:hypothetical protein